MGKHEIHRLQSIFDHRGRYAGALLFTAKGYDAYNAGGAHVDIFPDADRAVRKLCSLAQRQST